MLQPYAQLPFLGISSCALRLRVLLDRPERSIGIRPGLRSFPPVFNKVHLLPHLLYQLQDHSIRLNAGNNLSAYEHQTLIPDQADSLPVVWIRDTSSTSGEGG
jgi:hypothetical protein